jgi:hypothetical protein
MIGLNREPGGRSQHRWAQRCSEPLPDPVLGHIQSGPEVRLPKGACGYLDAVLTFRCIVIDENRRRTTLVVALPGAPLVGDDLELPHGETVIVHHVTSSSSDGLAGVIIAGPSP